MSFFVDDEMIFEGRSLPTNKLERLTMECATDEMRYPCRVNQKWYCVNDNGRWRKHKCKSMHTSLTGNKLLRKCACFTQEGLVYKTMIDVSTDRFPFFWYLPYKKTWLCCIILLIQNITKKNNPLYRLYLIEILQLTLSFNNTFVALLSKIYNWYHSFYGLFAA